MNDAADQTGRGAEGRPARRGLAAPTIGAALALSGLLGGAVIAWTGWPRDVERRPQRPRTGAPLERALSGALLDEDFNRLPLEERLRIARDLVERLREMDASQSALLAAFAAGVTGAAREQLEQNLTELMTDVMRRHADEYAAAPAERREGAMEEALLELLELRRELDPTVDADEADRPTPEERLKEMRQDAQRRAARQAGAPYQPTSAEDAGRLFGRAGEGMMEGRTPAERARMARFMRDSIRYLRGEDLATGQPKRDSERRR